MGENCLAFLQTGPSAHDRCELGKSTPPQQPVSRSAIGGWVRQGREGAWGDSAGRAAGQGIGQGAGGLCRVRRRSSTSLHAGRGGLRTTTRRETLPTQDQIPNPISELTLTWWSALSLSCACFWWGKAQNTDPIKSMSPSGMVVVFPFTHFRGSTLGGIRGG